MTFPDPAALDLTGFDLRALPPGFHDNPYPWYAALRHQSPVRAMPDGSVLLTRYRDCEAVYRDPKLYSRTKKPSSAPSSASAARCLSTTPPAWCSTTRRCTAVCAA